MVKDLKNEESMNMKKISTSTYTFEKLRKKNYIYVDKTQFFYKLIAEENNC